MLVQSGVGEGFVRHFAVRRVFDLHHKAALVVSVGFLQCHSLGGRFAPDWPLRIPQIGDVILIPVHLDNSALLVSGKGECSIMLGQIAFFVEFPDIAEKKNRGRKVTYYSLVYIFSLKKVVSLRS